MEKAGLQISLQKETIQLDVLCEDSLSRSFSPDVDLQEGSLFCVYNTSGCSLLLFEVKYVSQKTYKVY